MENEKSPETPAAPETPEVSTNPNELEFEMTPEQEADYVKQILADGDYIPPEPEKPAEEPETPKAPETPQAPEKPEEKQLEVEKVEDKPAETTAPQTNDLWVEVERIVVDDLGEETTETVKLVYDPADPASFIPDDFQAKSTKQLAEIMDAKAEMAGIYKERQSEHEAQESKLTADKQEQELVASWDREIEDLVKTGVLDAPKLKPDEAGYKEDPAVAKTEAVFDYLTKQNDERVKNGVAPITSFALAYTMFEKEAATQAAAEAAKKDEEDTKLKGAMVGGSSAASGGTAEQRAYVAGSHNSIWNVPVAD
jgi:hypothetical protein